jgi:hypothetical protein
VKINPWVKTTLFATVGGGIAAAFTAALDPSKYHFPADVGSGKLWAYFFEGAIMVGAALLIKSPLGQQVMTSYKESQAQLKESQEALAQAKADLKGKPNDKATEPK